MATLRSLKNILEIALDELLRARAHASLLKMEGTKREIEMVRAHLDSIIFEIEQKRIPEIAAAATV